MGLAPAPTQRNDTEFKPPEGHAGAAIPRHAA
jgi:hypothetical protein